MDKLSAPPQLLDALARSKAQIEAGQTVPADGILGRLRDSIARMELSQSPKLKPAIRKA